MREREFQVQELLPKITPCLISKSLLFAAVLFSLAGISLQAQQPVTNWVFKTGNSVYSSPAIGPDGTIYVGSLDGKLYALNPNGTAKWTFAANDFIGPSPAVDANGTIYVGSKDYNLYAINPDGSKKWAVPFRTGFWIHSSPSIGVDGTIYVGSVDRKIYAINPDGTKKWPTPFATGGEVYSSPAIGMDGTIYCGSRDNKLYALKPDGTTKWPPFETGGPIDSSPAVGPGGVIYVGSGDGKLYALNPDGTQKWAFDTGSPVNSSPGIGGDGTVYVGSGNGKLYGINGDGTTKWTFTATNSIAYSSPAIAADGTIYIGAVDGRLYAINADGTKKWAATTQAAITYSSPAIGPDGTVYVGSDDGRVYALKGSAGLANTPWPMFRRDARHTASGFVERQLIGGYSPGQKRLVNLVARPPATVGLYLLEEQPPAGWKVEMVSAGGWYDAAHHKVGFEFSFDSRPRTNSYLVTPPITEIGTELFSGSASADGRDSFIGGDSSLRLVPLHPADVNAMDNRLTIAEIVAYDLAWKRGQTWRNAPGDVPLTSIPVKYLARAIALWRGGEVYSYDASFAAPFSWFNTNSLPSQMPLDVVSPSSSGSGTNGGFALAEMPERYQTNKQFSVSITVMPDTNTIVYAVEDQPPTGWEVVTNTITGDGVWDSLNRKVKWGPEIVSDGASRSNLTYQIIPPVSATGTVEFAGVAIFDNSVTPIGGQRQMLLADRDLPAFVERRLPNGYTPGLKFTVTLFVTPPTNTAVYVVQDQPPVGWLVMTQNVAGLIDAASGTIEFGPFFDANPRTLTYDVTPLEGSDVVQFSGLVNADVLWSVIRGAHTLGKIPFHPADNVPAGDNYLTIAELTSYASAWKLERPWPNGPSPIPISFLANAIALWLHGEAYQYDPQTNSAPPSWTNRAVPPPWPPVPPGSPPANRGTAVADLPAEYQLGTNITVSITVTPQTNVTAYAVEDQPPDGWLVSQITSDGLWDDLTRKVKWGPFFDRVARTLAYQATPASNTLGAAVFAGVASFDGADLAISGQRQTGLSGGIGGVARRQLPGS
ncbi:MAG: PQQ-binding-like beta-propeller repeat protein, partial [Verrucomicrobiota bacterium]